MAFVNAVADGLADEVVGNGIAGEAVLGEEGPFLFDVIGFGEGAVHFEMVAPAGEFDAVVAHFFGEGQEVGEGKVGPLAGEKGDWSWHNRLV